MRDTVFDRRVFEQLVSELGSAESARHIASLYLELLDRRVARLVEACEADDVDTAMDAVLSLKVSSAMIGAAAMRDLAEQVEGCLVNGGCRAARGSLERVRRLRPTTATALRRLVQARPA